VDAEPELMLRLAAGDESALGRLYERLTFGEPLYYWVDDRSPGDTTGHEVGGVWFVVNP
jgi:predicted lipoprotein with Yx(FWY)xxD motif